MNRQRKLTWIEKKQIEKMAFDHPFFDIPGMVLSKKEAKAIIRSAKVRKSGAEIVAEVCDKADIPRPGFVDNHFFVFDNLKEVIAVPVIRRIGIIAIALILLVVFFAATPIGRAIAESVIQYITTLFDDGRLVVNKTDNVDLSYSITYDSFIGEKQDPNEITLQIVHINSFDEFRTVTVKNPVVLQLQVIELYYTYDKETNYLDLNATYETPSGNISTYQIWNSAEMESITSTGYSIYDKDKNIYYSIEDGTIHCIYVLDDSFFSISCSEDYTLDDVVELLKNKQ